MTPVLIVVVLTVLLAAGTTTAVLGWRARAARVGDRPRYPRYQPTSVDPRGRARVSKDHPDALTPTSYRLDTDHDDPDNTPRRPIATRRRWETS